MIIIFFNSNFRLTLRRRGALTEFCPISETLSPVSSCVSEASGLHSSPRSDDLGSIDDTTRSSFAVADNLQFGKIIIFMCSPFKIIVFEDIKLVDSNSLDSASGVPMDVQKVCQDMGEDELTDMELTHGVDGEILLREDTSSTDLVPVG